MQRLYYIARRHDFTSYEPRSRYGRLGMAATGAMLAAVPVDRAEGWLFSSGAEWLLPDDVERLLPEARAAWLAEMGLQDDAGLVKNPAARGPRTIQLPDAKVDLETRIVVDGAEVKVYARNVPFRSGVPRVDAAEHVAPPHHTVDLDLVRDVADAALANELIRQQMKHRPSFECPCSACDPCFTGVTYAEARAAHEAQLGIDRRETDRAILRRSLRRAS